MRSPARVSARCETIAPRTIVREIRVKGPNVTPGYRHDPEATRAAFDEERFLRTGDAGALKDLADPSRGILFIGRLAESKLDTGMWVNVGALRFALVERGAPLIEDVVRTGHDRDVLGALIFVRPSAAAALTDAPAAAHAALPQDTNVHRFIARVLAERNAAAPATPTRICKLISRRALRAAIVPIESKATRERQ